ncbi:MAG: hypothetical protein ACK5KR_08160 [Breznakia sp.]
MANRGYTLIESIIILFVIGCLLSITPVLKKTSGILFYETEKLSLLLTFTQSYAINKKEKTSLRIQGNAIDYLHKKTFLHEDVNCGNHEITFNERGNVLMATTITCNYYDTHKEIVITLGSGTHNVQ